jgi:hypothetical protein
METPSTTTTTASRAPGQIDQGRSGEDRAFWFVDNSASSSTSSSMPDQQGECAKPWKLFVGQVPKNVQEATIRSFFSPYGEIVHMNILRDRVTQVSKGTVTLAAPARSASMALRS